ncbi:Hpt domain-containing protein [Ferrimonas gelatinilytica]|uniref:Hpt domain-containing protein n=1 Tax=Ferrimonas gelatinilytica TaxID=1255257 RepID=A0ABP9S9A7_9GAMM
MGFEQLDTDTLDQYCAAIGAGTLMKSVVLFEQMAPEYVAAVLKGVATGDKETITREAHKLKGAAGSVGLKRIQLLSERLQRGEAPEWSVEHGTWLGEIQTHLDPDVAALKAYLTAKG